MSSGAHKKPARKKTLVGMRAPDLSGLAPAPQQTPVPAEPGQPAAATTAREPTVVDASGTNTAGTGAWANALLSARVRSEPRSPSVPDLGVDDLSDQALPPDGRGADATPRGFKTAGGRRRDAHEGDRRQGAEGGANRVGRSNDSTPGDDPGAKLPRPRQRRPASDVDDVLPRQQTPSSPGNNPRTSAIGGLIEASLHDDPVSEVGPVLLPDGPARTGGRSPAARPAVDAPWGLDDEPPGALPPLGPAVNSLSMTRGDDSVSLATLEGADGEVETADARTQRSGSIRSAVLGALIGFGVAAGLTGLWLWQGDASAPTSHRQAELPVPAPQPTTPATAASEAVPAQREIPAQPAPAPQPEATGEAAAPGSDDVAPAQPEPAEDDALDPPASAEDAQEPLDVPTAAGSALEQARALVDQAVYLRNNGREREAIANYQRALELQRGYGRAMAGLARVYLAKQDAERALYWAKRLNRNQPPRRDNQLLLGDAHQLAGSAEAARAAWTKAASLGSRSARSRLGQ